VCEGAAPDSTAARPTNQRGEHACRRPPARTHALIILRLGIDSWDCWGGGHEFLGQQDARHKVHKSKSNAAGCTNIGGAARPTAGPAHGRGLEMKTGTASTQRHGRVVGYGHNGRELVGRISITVCVPSQLARVGGMACLRIDYDIDRRWP
jgi:hypothetical protein